MMDAGALQGQQKWEASCAASGPVAQLVTAAPAPRLPSSGPGENALLKIKPIRDRSRTECWSLAAGIRTTKKPRTSQKSQQIVPEFLQLLHLLEHRDGVGGGLVALRQGCGHRLGSHRLQSSSPTAPAKRKMFNLNFFFLTSIDIMLFKTEYFGKMIYNLCWNWQKLQVSFPVVRWQWDSKTKLQKFPDKDFVVSFSVPADLLLFIPQSCE